MNISKSNKNLCFALALLMLLPFITGIVGLFSFSVAAAPSGVQIKKIYDTRTIDYLPGKTNITIEFTFEDESSTLGDGDKGKKFVFKDKDFNLNYTVWGKDSSELIIEFLGIGASGKPEFSSTLTKLKHKGNSNDRIIELDVTNNSQNNAYTPGNFGVIEIPEEYFQRGGSTSGGSEEVEFSSEVAFENVIIMDKEGNRLDKVTKETPPFSILVTFREYGMEEFDFDNIPDSALSVMFKDGSGFYSNKGTSGVLEPLVSSPEGAPRFKALFKNISYDGSADIDFTISPWYQIDGYRKKGNDVTAQIRIAEPDKEEEEDEKEKIAPLKPYIIVSEYSYGDSQIEAGTDFTLNLGYTNTSADIPLENIVMTVTTPEDLSIASSSNTIYVPALGAKQSLSHSFDIKAKPNAEVGSAELEIEFKYQYIDAVNEKREEVTSTEKIAIPIIQLDRFEVDPITEIQEMAMVGEPFYITVSFINRGKSPTYNISAKVKSSMDLVSAGQHFGNLEPGKSDSMDISVIPNEPGEMLGDIIIQYEDENANEKEITTSFSFYVDTPFVPEMPDDMQDTEQPEPETGKFTIAMSVIGSLFIAAPIAYYFVMRKKQKESEFHDEDF